MHSKQISNTLDPFNCTLFDDPSDSGESGEKYKSGESSESGESGGHCEFPV